MLTPAPPPDLDLLVVGGLTVDAFEDGTTAAGGALLHAALAAGAAGLRVGALGTGGPEPEVEAAIRDLAQLDVCVIERVPGSIRFEHRTEMGRRHLRLLRGGDAIGPAPGDLRARAVLFAPVAGEVGPELVSGTLAGARRGAALQGWLRRLVPGEPAAPRPLTDLPAPLRSALGTLDLVVASREDLVAGSDDPEAQLGAMRGAFPTVPALVLSDGEAGAWVDLVPRGSRVAVRRHEPVGQLVRGVSSVGAGDMLAAFLLAASPPDGDDAGGISRWMAEAMRAVAVRLAERR